VLEIGSCGTSIPGQAFHLLNFFRVVRDARGLPEFAERHGCARRRWLKLANRPRRAIMGQRRRGNVFSEGETTQSNPRKIMAKTQNSKKQTKKLPLKTAAQKKADKRGKKNAR
jgi:hypothetical protein